MGDAGRERALVLGGSLGGLFAARALADHFAEVLVVDRDALVGVTEPRRSVPHGRHAHGLLARGQQVLEARFPGLTDELVAAGVPTGDLNTAVRWCFGGRPLAPEPTGLTAVGATRPVLEYHVRGRVQRLPNVTLLERHDILALLTTPDRRRVTGARVRPRGGALLDVPADLVLDCTGRGSRTPAWLAELGYRRPEEDRVTIGLTYTTAHFRLAGDPFDGGIAILPIATPASPRGAFFYRVPGAGDVIELTLTGILGDRPPADPAGFLDYTGTVPVPAIHAAVSAGEPVDEPVSFTFPASVRRRYETLPELPAGLLVIGDAVCSFNPVYGQGMTVAALESLTLDRHLARGGEVDPRAFFADVARDVDAPWEISAGADLGYPGVRGRRTAKVRLANAYLGRLQGGAVRDPALASAFLRVTGLVDPPTALLRPRTLARVLRHGQRPPEPAPSTFVSTMEDRVAGGPGFRGAGAGVAGKR
jgi:2-polyprenyl-6-methoxyphenol hydroxylase-like FAD-dependent oxidoreductase